MRIALTATLVAALGLAACADDSQESGAAASPSEPSTTVRLVIPDLNIREPGVSCQGASGFRFAHPEAEFAIQDADGENVVTGVLPQGVAEKALTIDLGEERQPTVCVMNLELSGVSSVDDHSVVVSDRSPVPIRPNSALDGAPEAVLS